MLKPLKFKGSEHNYFFVSDLHYGHNRDFIYEKRNYKSVEDHDSGIIHQWNANVSHEATVFHLGDFIFGDGDGKKFWELCRRLSFDHLYLMLGNHTSGHRQAYLKTLQAQFPDAYDSELNYEVYPLTTKLGQKSITFLPTYVEAFINSTPLVLCHYPIMSFLGDGKDYIHLCGHSHSNNPMTNKDTGIGYRLDVGIESFGRPISLLEVKKHLNGREIHSYDHHGKT